MHKSFIEFRGSNHRKGFWIKTGLGLNSISLTCFNPSRCPILTLLNIGLIQGPSPLLTILKPKNHYYFSSFGKQNLAWPEPDQNWHEFIYRLYLFHPGYLFIHAPEEVLMLTARRYLRSATWRFMSSETYLAQGVSCKVLWACNTDDECWYAESESNGY